METAYIEQIFNKIDLSNKDSIITKEEVYNEICKQTDIYLVKNNIAIPNEIIEELILKTMCTLAIALYK